MIHSDTKVEFPVISGREAPGPRAIRRASLTDILRDVWTYRDLLVQFMLRDIRVRYKQAIMGFGWALLMPILVVAAGGIVRLTISHSAGQPATGMTFAVVAIKSIPWAFFVGALTLGTTCLTANLDLVTKVYFPREVLPLGSVLAQSFDGLVAGALVFLLLPLLGVRYSGTLVWVPVLAVLLLGITTSAVLLLSCANLYFRDVKYIVQVLLTFGIFFTPVFFEPSMLGARGAAVAFINPLAAILEGFRLAVIGHHNLLMPLSDRTSSGVVVMSWSPWLLAYVAILAGVGGRVALGIFNRASRSFAEYA